VCFFSSTAWFRDAGSEIWDGIMQLAKEVKRKSSGGY
jgi:hypothetical protein